eukprot:m.693359 g.693359  ORF g.693359 m.693359 type:complete len:68 (+) comp22871_c0_seq25:2351-2554(+)
MTRVGCLTRARIDVACEGCCCGGGLSACHAMCDSDLASAEEFLEHMTRLGGGGGVASGAAGDAAAKK